VITLFFLRRGLPSTIGENPLWLVVLCDMMTNLMLFFLVMYSFTMLDSNGRKKWERSFSAADVVADPRQARAQAVVRQFREQDAGAAMDEILRKSGLEDMSEIQVSQRSIRVRLRDKVLFPSARAELSDGARASLSRLARVLREMPNEVIVEGHTDDVPIAAGPYRTNWALSVARAYSVIELLIAEGIPPARLIASGYGPHHPLAGNATPALRSRNRRVEIVILRGKDDM